MPRAIGVSTVRVEVFLFPPLEEAAGRPRVVVEIEEPATIGAVLEALAAAYGVRLTLLLFPPGTRRPYPQWSFLVGERLLPGNGPDVLEQIISPGESLTILLPVSGG